MAYPVVRLYIGLDDDDTAGAGGVFHKGVCAPVLGSSWMTSIMRLVIESGPCDSAVRWKQLPPTVLELSCDTAGTGFGVKNMKAGGPLCGKTAV